LIGAIFDDDNGTDSGAAYIFELIGGNWTETAKLIASDGDVEDRFGSSVSLSGNRALIGAHGVGTKPGSSYVFDLQGGSWSQTAKLMASDGAANDYFGYSVSLSGDRALVGAFRDNNGSNIGSVYVYDLQGGSWTETTKLIASDVTYYFGFSVSLSGDRALIGTYGNEDNGSNSGAAYVFDLQGGSWSQTDKLLASDGAANDYFGWSVSLYGDRALIGAYGDADNGSYSGSAYVFDLSGGSWAETAKLTAADGSANDYFGNTVSLFGDRALIGAFFDDAIGNDSGSAYVFDLQGGGWIETDKLIASDGAVNNYFGFSVSLSGEQVLIGAYGDNDNGNSSGSAYIFKLVDDLIFRNGFEFVDLIFRDGFDGP